MKVGIIGKGTVGKAVYEGLNHLGHQMSFFDPAYEGSTLNDVLDTDCVFLSVPTNQAPNGDCDTSIIERVVGELNDAGYKGLVAIKSTVIPGTTDRMRDQYPNLRMANVPEFLRARTALADFVLMQLFVSNGKRHNNVHPATLWVLAPVAMGPIFLGRFDVFPTLIVCLALFAAYKPVKFGAWIAVGAILKVWPVLGLLAIPRRDFRKTTLGFTEIGRAHV